MRRRLFHIVTVHPQMVTAACQVGVFERASRQDKIQYQTVNLRKFAYDDRGSVDSAPYGGGDGMVMRVDVLARALRSLSDPGQVIFLSPSGKPFHQQQAQTLATADSNFTFICGRFGGVDQRFVETFVDHEISLGDYVTAGGELPALVVMEAITRLVPGVLGATDSAARDSFAAEYEGLLEHPQYTRPETFEDQTVPAVLLSGDHQAIAEWQQRARRQRTQQRRPDLWQTYLSTSPTKET